MGKININNEKLIEYIKIAKPYSDKGKVADYIPALALHEKSNLAIAVSTNNNVYSAGNTQEKFTIQSISKVITLAMALEEFGREEVFKKVGMEPTEYTFNSISNLEKHKKPINPMVNAGALTITNMITGENTDDKLNKILDRIQRMANNPNITYNKSVAESEYETASVNRALCYLLLEYKLIDENIEELLQLYTKQCAIEINATDLAHIAMVLANNGINPQTGEEIIPRELNRIINVIMFVCGMYNVSGNFAMNVGFPAKSGVSGALIGVIPGEMGIGIYGPALNEYGNSIAGTKLLELISEDHNLCILS